MRPAPRPQPRPTGASAAGAAHRRGGVRPARAVALVGAIATVVGLGLAEAQRRAARPVLHEDLPDEPGAVPSPLLGATGSGALPAAIAAGDKLLPSPATDRAAAAGEPVLGAGGFAADRATEARPDYQTGADATLRYASVFNPDVVPFKRMSAFDGVAEDYALGVARRARVEVPVGGATDRARDRFWGSVMVQLVPGVDAPLPSVAPDMRILSYEASPPARLRFSRDGADNFFVRTDDPAAAGPRRLVFLVDADAGYFAPALPTGRRLTPRLVGEAAPPELRPRLPPAVLAAGRQTLRRLGLSPDQDLGVAFNALVAYFRGFEAKPPPPATGDIYRDLVDHQAGVCRHRSFAFVVTAGALGLPARYVENEAHAFVEVWFPQRGWQRLDLGGAALRLEVTGAEDKTLHRPRADDPFAKPPAYRDNYTQLAGDVRGLSEQQLADRRRAVDAAPASGEFPAGPGGAPGAGGGEAAGPAPLSPDPTLPAATLDPRKPSLRLFVTTADTAAYRGDALHVEGRVAAALDGAPLPDHPVDVFLAPAGQRGASPLPLGRAVTGADGTFRADFTVPASVNLASYELYLASPEDARFNAALSD